VFHAQVTHLGETEIISTRDVFCCEIPYEPMNWECEIKTKKDRLCSLLRRTHRDNKMEPKLWYLSG
jgi:hypothetical protein